MNSSRLRALGQYVRERDSAGPGSTADDPLRHLLGQRARSGAERRRTRRRVAATSLLLVAAGGALVLGLGRVQETSLAFTAGDPPRPGVVGELLSPSSPEGLSLRFSDASRIVVADGARARVVALHPRGAELVLEAGEALVDVVPHEGNAWRVHAGPAVVDVVGTRFDVSWEPQAQTFQLELFEGKLSLRGPCFGAAREVHPGQRVRATCNTRQAALEGHSKATSIDPDSSEATHSDQAHSDLTRDESGPTQPASAVTRNPQRSEAAASTQRPDPLLQGDGWRELARDGRYAQALSQASRQGFGALCRQADAEDLLLLGEAARLAGGSEQAVRAYRALRARFAGSFSAARAAFHLGQLDMQAGRLANAASGFETYLREQPDGALAAAALGRLMEARIALGNAASASEAARSYLERYPAGAHTRLARDVLSKRPTSALNAPQVAE